MAFGTVGLGCGRGWVEVDTIEVGIGVLGNIAAGVGGDATGGVSTVAEMVASALLGEGGLVGEDDDAHARENTNAARTRLIPNRINRF